LRRSPGGNYTQIASLGANVTSYSDTTVSGNTEYVYRIQPFNVSEQSYSHVVWVKTPVLTTPAAPSGLTAAAVSSSQINLAWTDNANTETGFKIERKTGAGGTYAQIATVGANATTYNNSGLSAATTYYYRVRATNSSGDSAYSNEANATTQPSGGGGPGLQGDYYDNIDFTNLKTTRTDATVNFDFGTGIPAGTALTSGDTFSVRWTGQVQPQFSESYTFYTVSDDGVRLWVNNQLLIDKWIDQAPTEWSGNITVTANQKYDIRMDFYENGGGAQARLSWSSASTPKAIIPQSQLFLPPSGTAYASDLAWASALNGWGPVERDKSNGETGAGDGTTITLNGTTYAKGLGVHANSEVVYNINGAYSAFLADVGVDDEVGASGSVVFQVWADGTKIYDSGTMNGSAATKNVNVSIAGKNQVKLTVTDAGDGNSYDHADWANARFTSSGVTVSVNDNTIGTGNNQFEYVSSANWPFSPEPGAFNNDNHYSQTANAYYQVRFSGTQAKVYTKKNSNHGIMAISIDGGTETNADSYSSTTVQQALVYTSPLLAAGQHTLKVRVTGTKNASSTDTWIIADRVDVSP